MYKPNPQSEFRVKFDFRVDFTNGGYVEGHDFLLDLEGATVSDKELKGMIVESMNLAKAGEVQIFKKEMLMDRIDQRTDKIQPLKKRSAMEALHCILS
jgi:hypothetical protein